MQIAELVAQHYEAVFRVAFRLTGSVQDAEDLTQQAFLDAQRTLSSLREPDRAKAWLGAIVRNRYRQLLRRADHATSSLELADEPENPVLTSEVEKDKLQAVLNELPDDYRTVLVMYYFEELSYSQLAEELGVPVGTVMSRLSRAKQHLRQRLKPEEW